MAEDSAEAAGSPQEPGAGRKRLTWNPAKNDQLKRERGIAFETIAYYLEQHRVLAVTAHPNPARYPNQRMFVFQINDYIYLVPFVESDTEIFLKTIIPSRKATRAWLGRRPPHDPAPEA
jgi:hypothetical protein